MFLVLNKLGNRLLHPSGPRTGRILFKCMESTSETKPEKEESNRMRQFHEKLKLQSLPNVDPRERFVDLVLVETDEKGELITDPEKDPTKWGDWQTGGRVSDF